MAQKPALFAQDNCKSGWRNSAHHCSYRWHYAVASFTGRPDHRAASIGCRRRDFRHRAYLIRVSDSHIARLPSSVKPLTVYRQKAFQWIWRLLVFLLVCTAATLILPSSWRWLPSGLGGFVLLISCPMLTALYMRARRLDFGMSQVTSRPWVHWQYSPEQWIAWTNSQFERERSQVQPFSWNRDGRKYLKATLVFGLPLFIGCWLAETKQPASNWKWGLP